MQLKKLRKQKGISQAALAKELGVVRSTICQYEKGNREPDNKTLCALAKFFNVSLDTLLSNPQSTFTDEERALGLSDNHLIALSDDDRELINLFAEAEEKLGKAYVRGVKQMVRLAIDAKEQS